MLGGGVEQDQFAFAPRRRSIRHEAPRGGIVGKRLDATGRGYLLRIGTAAARMRELIGALHDLARVGRAQMLLRPVDLSVMARELAAELRHGAPEREIEFDIAETPAAEGDARLLRIALHNLLGNAWKYTARRDRARIEFGAETKDGSPTYFVRDNGVGFDSALAAKKLFQPFQRLHGAEEAPGSGIGLATVRRIVTKHGGTIWAQSAKDDGATFWFTLGHE